MSRENLILIGAGGHSISCIDVIEQEGRFKIAGLVGRTQEVGTKLFDYSVLSTDSGLPKLAKQYPFALITVGQIVTAEHRIRLFREALDAGFKFPSIVSPNAYVSQRAEIGQGTIVMHGAIVNAGVKIGDNCIINSNSLIEHESHIADHCHISTGAILNGGVSIGSECFIGSGSIVKQFISIGAKTLVGMGLTVRKDLGENTKLLNETTV